MRLDGVVEFSSVADAKALKPKGASSSMTIVWQESDTAVVWVNGKALSYTYESTTSLTPDDKKVIALTAGGYLVATGGSGGVEQYANFASLPVVGDAGILYLVNDTVPSSQYRWDTTTSTYVSLAPAVKEVTVYVNSTSPTTATIFDLENPPVTHDPLLMNREDVIYIGTDGSTWTSNGTIYKTYVAPASTEWYLSGTTTDAGSNKTARIYRTGFVGVASVAPFVPNSAIDAESVGFGYSENASTTTVALNNTNHTVILTANFIQNVVLPSAGTVMRREYHICNPTGIAKTISTYKSINQGATSTVIPPYSALLLQSDGTNWNQLIPFTSYTQSGGINVLSADTVTVVNHVSPWTTVNIAQWDNLILVPAGKTVSLEVMATVFSANGAWGIGFENKSFAAGDTANGMLLISNYTIPGSGTGGNYYQLGLNTTNYDTKPSSTRQVDNAMTGNTTSPAYIHLVYNWRNNSTSAKFLSLGWAGDLNVAYNGYNLTFKSGSLIKWWTN